MIDRVKCERIMDWLDQRNSWQFVGILYVIRWIVLAPVLVLILFIFPGSQLVPNESFHFNPIILLCNWVAIDPLFETLLECSLLYFIFSRVGNYREKKSSRCWGFVTASACFMALLHPVLASLLPALITGVFLAYCYAHFADRKVGQAILATTCFHGAINIVGWSMIVLH